MKKTNARLLILAALFTSLIAITAQVSIPIPYVPINLALLAVHLAGSVLGARYGFACVAAYLLLGAAGLPVFSGFRGGIAVIAGNTGGYLAGYALCALLTGYFCNGRRQIVRIWLGMVPGTLACYAVIMLLGLAAIRRHAHVRINILDVFIKPCLAAAICVAAAKLSCNVLSSTVGGRMSTVIGLCVAVVVYGLVMLLIKGVSKSELKMLPKGEQIIKILEKSHLMR